tara:strand:+ start:56 stop:436 length:381 start_codon:yes stop_codon:yes gene_type:complete
MERNVLGKPIETCSIEPMTGFFRDGCCRTSEEDVGKHTVCVELTAEFLAFSKSRGNDLSTPRPEYRFPGLKAGDRWCLCFARWLEAYHAGIAPKLVLESTHESVADELPMELLLEYAACAEGDLVQ